MLDASLGRYASFILRLSVRPLSGLVRKADPSPVKFPDKTGTVGFWLLLFFLKLYFRTLDILFLWLLSCVWSRHPLEVSALVLMVLLIFHLLDVFRRRFQKVGEFSDHDSKVFRKGLWRCWRTCWLFLCGLALSAPSNILGGYTLLSLDFLFIWPLIWRCYFGGILLVHQFLVMIGAPKFPEGLLSSIPGDLLPVFFVSLWIRSQQAAWLSQSFPIFLGFLWSSQKECFATANYVPRSMHFSLYFTCLVTEKVSMGCFISLWQDFLFGHIS